MTSTISTLAPLAASGVYTSNIVPAAGSGGITLVGTVFADQAGTLAVQQSFDQTNWDVQNTFSVAADAGQPFSVDLYAPYLRVIYTNGATAQTQFRLYADLRDSQGNFVTPQVPSAGGEYIVLLSNGGNYQVVGRFDGASGWDACANAAIMNNQSGKYAAFDIALGVVAQETITKNTDVAAASF
jgi:hypothetical protein